MGHTVRIQARNGIRVYRIQCYRNKESKALGNVV